MRGHRVFLGVLVATACGSPQGAGGGGASTSGTSGTSGPYFDHSMFFNHDVSAMPKAAASDPIIASLRGAGGWGNGDRMQIDFSIDVLAATPATPRRTFTPTDDFYTPDCDHVAVPVPAGGNLEGETGYACDGDGDCHLIVFDPTARQALRDVAREHHGATFHGGCLAVWDTRARYTDTLRGDQCTSADAAGFPIAPLLFTADEVAAGEIDHAIRFILPNDRVKRGYRSPGDARHATRPAAPNAPSYGVHLRLRADYPLDVAAERRRAGRRARDAEVRHVSRRRRQHRADRAERPLHDGEVGRPARPARPGRAPRRGLRGHRPRGHDPAHVRLRDA